MSADAATPLTLLSFSGPLSFCILLSSSFHRLSPPAEAELSPRDSYFMTECVIRASFSKAKLPLSSQREARDVSLICSSKKLQLLIFCADCIDLMIAVLGHFSHPILKSLKIVYLQPSTTTPALLSPCLLTSERYQALCDITKGCKLKMKFSSVVVSHLVSSSIVS